MADAYIHVTKIVYFSYLSRIILTFVKIFAYMVFLGGCMYSNFSSSRYKTLRDVLRRLFDLFHAGIPDGVVHAVSELPSDFRYNELAELISEIDSIVADEEYRLRKTRDDVVARVLSAMARSRPETNDLKFVRKDFPRHK